MNKISAVITQFLRMFIYCIGGTNIKRDYNKKKYLPKKEEFLNSNNNKFINQKIINLNWNS